MTAPTVVSQGAHGGVGGSTQATASPTLPGSRVTNNLLIAWVSIPVTGKVISVSGTGWTLGGTNNSGGMSGAWAWCLVTGTEAAPTFSWTGNAGHSWSSVQLTGNKTISPFGNTNSNIGSSAAPTITAVTTTGNDSAILAITGTAQTSIITRPVTPWVSAGGGNSAVGANSGALGTVAKSGDTSEAAAFSTVTSNSWFTFAIEVLAASGGPTGGAERATQIVQQILEAYSDTSKVRVTQVVQQVLRTISFQSSIGFGYIIDGLVAIAYASFDGTVTNVTLSNGNLTATHSITGTNAGARSTFYKSSGRYYFEITVGATAGSGDSFGIMTAAATYATMISGASSTVTVVYLNFGSGAIYSNGTSTGLTIGDPVATDIIGVAIDLDNRKGWFRRNNGNWNGQAIGSQNPATTTGGVTIGAGSFAPAVAWGGATPSQLGDNATANFGQSAYSGTPPSGFGNWIQ